MTSSRAAIRVTMVESKGEEHNDIDVQLILDVISRAMLIGVKKNAGMEDGTSSSRTHYSVEYIIHNCRVSKSAPSFNCIVKDVCASTFLYSPQCRDTGESE